jgi:hypothetical protein
MVGMGMGKKYPIEAADSRGEGLKTKLSGGVDQDCCRFVPDQH